MIVSTLRPENDNILIVSDKFWDKLSATSSDISNIGLKCDPNLMVKKFLHYVLFFN